MLLTNNGLLYTVGSNSDGQLGISNSDVELKNAPVLVEGFVSSKVKKISAGGYHSTAILNSGELYTWGSGAKGALGLATGLHEFTPSHVDFSQITANFITEVSAGHSHTLCIDETGIVYVFGSNEEGQLGVGTNKNEFSPFRVKAISERVT